MFKAIPVQIIAAALAVAAALVLPAAADQNAAKDQNGNPCLKINCEGGSIENHCDRPVNFAACHAENQNGCLLENNPLPAIPPKESLPFACKLGKLVKADGCFPPFIPVSFSAVQNGCIPDPKNPQALTAAALPQAPPPELATEPEPAEPEDPLAALRGAPPPAGTPTENALRKCNAWPGQLNASARVNTAGNETEFHKDWECNWLHTETHLHIASRMNDSKSARWLIANGAEVNAKENGSWTPLHVAAEYNATETAALLLKNGAEVNAKNNDGWTPLHLAAANNTPETAALLLKNGAEVNAKNNDGYTPLDSANLWERSEMQSLLKRHGGRCNKKC